MIPWEDTLQMCYVVAERLFGVKLTMGEKLLIKREAERFYPHSLKQERHELKRATELGLLDRMPLKSVERVERNAAYRATLLGIGSYADKFDVVMPSVEETAQRYKEHNRGVTIWAYAPQYWTNKRTYHNMLSGGGQSYRWKGRSSPWIFKGQEQ